MITTSLPVKNIPLPENAARFVLAGALVGVALLLGACSRNNGARDGDLVLSGNIEVTDAQLGFKVAGRVAERLVSEGDNVKAGQLVARLDDAEQKEQVALRRAELAGAEAALAELEAGSRPQEIAASEATLRSAEADRRAATAPASVAPAEAPAVGVLETPAVMDAPVGRSHITETMMPPTIEMIDIMMASTMVARNPFPS